jgi:hypothetical protein
LERVSVSDLEIVKRVAQEVVTKAINSMAPRGWGYVKT